jgi:hypothetical protein
LSAKRLARISFKVAALAVAVVATGCSGDGSTPPGIAPLSVVSVTVAPHLSTLNVLQTQQFTATVENSANPAVAWDVDGVAGGSPALGTISAAGLFTPPSRAGTHTITAASVEDPDKRDSAQVTVQTLSGMLTYHNDAARTGQNQQETLLAPANVNAAGFGRLFSFPVDGYVYAQPLYVRNVPIGGQPHNVVLVATEHDSVYAFDADNQVAAPLWHTSFIDPATGVTTVPSDDVSCDDLVPEIGITGTPVIDPATGTLYVVAKTKENGVYIHRLHALDITNGSARPGSGTVIQASVPGTGDPNDGSGDVLFGYDSLRANQRAALLLSNRTVYIAFASHCDLGPYHGWAMAYDADTLTQVAALNATPDGSQAGIWQSGGGPAADVDGNVYLITGNGTFDADSGGQNFGNSFLMLSGATLTVTDYFTPYNQQALSDADQDVGAGGPVLLPDQPTGPAHLIVSAGKDGTIYLLDRDNMGHFQPGSDSQIVQSLPFALGTGTGADGYWSVPAYFSNTLYFVGVDDSLKAYALTDGKLGTTPVARSAELFPFPGAVPVVSANGASDAIVWVIGVDTGGRAVLRAYLATDVSAELYDSDQNVARDDPGLAVKFTVPTVVDGRVYVGTQDSLTAFGLLP